MLNQNLLLTGDDGYNLTKSLRFRSSASAFLNKTLASPTNNKKFTWSAWVKRGSVTAGGGLFDAYYDGSNFSSFFFQSNGTIQFYNILAGTDSGFLTTPVYRDPSAWYHIVFVYDSANATAADRGIIYVNNVRQTVTNPYGQIGLNEATYLNNVYPNYIGRQVDAGLYFDGYIAELNFIDGQALTPSSFGSTNATTGVWQPAKYTGTYGTNGFYLPFTNTASTTALGYDSSGNSNNWTTNNFSISSNSTYDSMTDVPTLTSATTANYTVWNPLQTRTAAPTTYSNGNLRVQFSDTGIYQLAFGTIGIKSNKYYWEVTVTSVGTQGFIGIADINSSPLDVPTVQRVYANNGQKGNYSSLTSYGASYTAGDVIGVAVDADSGTITFYKNNTSQGVAFTDIVSSMPASGWTAFAYGYNGTDFSVNFGQQPFTYTPPTGFVALNTYNLPTSTIVKGNTVMDATLYTGTNATQSIVNTAGFKSDFLWVKRRDTSGSHLLWDSVRGVTLGLNSDRTAAEQTATGGTGLASFNSNGFTLGGDFSGTGSSNTNGATYVGWQWQAGQGTTSSNTSGSITSTVSVNPTAGFSVVTFTAQTSGTATVGHGLGVAPKMIITKVRNNTSGWTTYFENLDNTQYIVLNSSAALAASSTVWNNTSPTSSVFTLGSAFAAPSQTMVAYCWAEIAGYSKFSYYIGNGSTDGPFVYTGFRPKYVMFKRVDSTGDWYVWDTVRNTYNAAGNALYPNYSVAEVDYGTGASGIVDILSNGFKLRTNGVVGNSSGATYIYACFAENPQKFSLAR